MTASMTGSPQVRRAIVPTTATPPPSDDREIERHDRELERRRQPLGEQREHVAVQRDRGAEIAAQRIPRPRWQNCDKELPSSP